MGVATESVRAVAGWLKGLLRAPLLHFLAIGGALFLIAGNRGPAPVPAEREPVIFTAADIERLRNDWTERFGAPPTAATEAKLVDAAIDEEVLYREALALGLDHASVVRDRLARLARFVDDGLPEDLDASEAAARRLGLDRHDLVIRRHLVNSMRLVLAAPQASDAPEPTELTAYYDRHADEFHQPPRVRFAHAYFSRDRRGTAVEADAERALAELQHRGVGSDGAAQQGDPFIRGPQIGPAAAEELQRLFGADFAAAVARAEPRTWIGPISSAYGLHLVWVHERIDGGRPPLASVRGQVLHQLLHARQLEHLRRRLDELRARYSIQVEGSSRPQVAAQDRR